MSLKEIGHFHKVGCVSLLALVLMMGDSVKFQGHFHTMSLCVVVVSIGGDLEYGRWFLHS